MQVSLASRAEALLGLCAKESLIGFDLFRDGKVSGEKLIIKI